MADTRSVLFLGRHVGYPVALEGALKLKELAYIHAEGFAAGELKHGPIALIEPGQIVFVIVPSPRDPLVAAPQGGLATSRRSAPAAPGSSRSPRRATSPCCRSPTRSSASRSPRRCSSRCWRSCRCTSSAWSSPPPRASTSTSRATWRSRSRSSNGRRNDRRGIGVDVVDLARFERAVARTPRLRERLFAPSERDELPLRSLAGRFAAKEALMKALGESTGVRWHDMEVVNDGEGNPSFVLPAPPPSSSQARGIVGIHLSMTHDAGVAIAYVVGETA